MVEWRDGGRGRSVGGSALGRTDGQQREWAAAEWPNSKPEKVPWATEGGLPYKPSRCFKLTMLRCMLPSPDWDEFKLVQVRETQRTYGYPP